MEINQKYTIIEMGSIGFSIRREIQIKQNINGSFTFCLKGKRKQFYIKAWDDKSTMMFKNWDLPIKLESETNNFMGNACINFITEEPQVLRDFILNNNLNKNLDLGIVLYRSQNERAENLKPLFKEMALLTAPSHACVRTALKNIE